jgi:hypothetical protein
MSTLNAALRQLDPKNDNHWTSDGLPRLETVRLMAGDAHLTREAVTAAAPGFTRGKAVPLQAVAAVASEHTTSPTAIAAPAAEQPAAQGELSDDTPATGAEDGVPDEQTEPDVPEAEDPIGAATKRVEAASAAQAQANREYSQAVAVLDALLDAAASSGAQETLAQQVGSYHQRQLAALQQRGDQQRRLRDANIDLKALLPQRSQLDQSLARKTARGGQRPNLPLRK